MRSLTLDPELVEGRLCGLKKDLCRKYHSGNVCYTESNMLSITKGRIITESGRIVKGAITVRGRSISSIGKKVRGGGEVYDVRGMYVSPGFIDLHVHGGAGHDFLEARGPALRKILECHARYGTTALLATIRTASAKRMEIAIAAIGRAMIKGSAGPTILGVHLEGPFLSRVKKGAQAARSIRKPNASLFSGFISSGVVRLVTLAPEEEGALRLVELAGPRGVICAMGHTNATYGQAAAAIERGVSYATHTFNAMRGLGHREPGAAGAVLESDGVVAEIIADGRHLHPAVVRIILKIKGIKGIVLATDCMKALDSTGTAFRVSGEEVRVRDGAPRFSSGVLCGSVLTMNRAVKNLMEFTGVGLTEAIKPATINPARLLKLERRKGSLAVGKDADMVVFDDNLDVGLVVVGGKVVFSNI